MQGVNLHSRVFKLETRLVQKLCESIGSARAITVYMLIEAGEWRTLMDLTINPLHYESPQRFADDYLVTSVLSKNPRVPLGVDRRAVALDKFDAAEEKCRMTNDILESLQEGTFVPLDRDVQRLLPRVKSIVAKILGPLSQKTLNRVYESCGFGPGATTSLSGVVTQGKKYSSRVADCTTRLLPFRTFCLPPLWRETFRDVRITDSSKMEFVPKNAKTDRTICIEPDLNIYVQKGVGAVIRDRLAAFGLDLSSQEWNRFLAGKAWEWDLSTVDLSSASDTVARQLVRYLLPWEWVELLLFCRTDKVRHPVKGEIELEKWSSMGNGYTFELESLIFFAVAYAIAEEDPAPRVRIAVYGDDIIVPNRHEGVLTRTLEFLGFSVNREKSFGIGPFHESCGSDFFHRVNVRPFFLRAEIDEKEDTRKQSLERICYLYANAIVEYASRSCGGLARDSRFLPAWLLCFTTVDQRRRYRIPQGFGDDAGFNSSFDEALPGVAKRVEHGHGGYVFRYSRRPAVEKIVSSQGAYFAFLSGKVTDTLTRGREALRGRYDRAVTRSGTVLNWPHLGPWV